MFYLENKNNLTRISNTVIVVLLLFSFSWVLQA